MFKSIRNIIILIVITIVVYFLPWLCLSERNESYPKYSKEVKIYQLDKNNLQVVENIVANIDEANEHSLLIPIAIYKDYNVELIDTTKITVNNEEILTKYENEELINKETIYNNNELFKNINKDIIYSRSTNFIEISTKDYTNFEAGKYLITISYKCNINDVITNYNNMAVLRIKRNTYYDMLNVTMVFPTTPSNFDVGSNKAKVENMSGTTYKVDLTNVTKNYEFEYVSFAFDNDIFSNAKKVYENFDITKETSILSSENESNKIYFFVITISTIILFVVTIFITKRGSREKNYLRDLKDVISPMLAETLIDGKMGSKELIMTAIVELICRKNIQNIDNDKFKLVSRDNLLDYEEQLIDMIFGTKSIISFNDINNMFINSNENTSFFVQQFKQIKKKILDKLFELELYSKKGEIVLERIRTISIMIYVNIIILLRNILLTDRLNFIMILIVNIIVFLLIKMCMHMIKNNKPLYIKTGDGKKFTLAINLVALLIIDIMILVGSLGEHYIIFTMLLVVIILNSICMYKSKRHILTQKGKDEYKKVYGLKSYIMDFSVMSEKDVDSAIIWDEYLAYAVAFSIPNKITSKFNSTLIEANIILQNIDKFIMS